MRKILILLVLNNLCLIACAQTVYKNRLTINKSTQNSAINIEHPHSIHSITFNQSKIETLDISWKKLINVKTIRFMNSARIPKNISYIPNLRQIEFTRYGIISFPSDFPFEKFDSLRFTYVTQLPQELANFIQTKSLSIHECPDRNLQQKVKKLPKIKELSLSEIQPILSNYLSNFAFLESLRLINLNIENGLLNLNELLMIRHIEIEFTNLQRMEISTTEVDEIILRYSSQLRPEESEKLKLKFENTRTKLSIWRGE